MDNLTNNQQDITASIISRYLAVEDVTYGDAKTHFIARFRGRLYDQDSAAAYDRLSAELKSHGLTPLFRWEGDRHVILLIPNMVRPRLTNPWWNIILFIATLFSVMLTGAMLSMDSSAQGYTIDSLEDIFAMAMNGLPFAASLLIILGAHEFGHYLAGRWHKVRVTLPYFIPFPMSLLGTLGAFINIQEPPKNRRVMFDISVAGPIAGLVFAIPILIFGLTQSQLDQIPQTVSQGLSFTIEGNSILYLLAKKLVFNQWLPIPVDFGGLPPLIYWLKYFFTGQPLPLGGIDVMISPIVWAGWAGLLVTCLNLIPAGQLDGGHILATLVGNQRMQRLLPIIILCLGVLGLVWSGWWLWAFLLLMFGRIQAETLDEITPLDSRRRWMGMAVFIIFVLVFSPVPLITFGG
ncbi:MAG: site-2 protease family protein [Anaerolineaceae bacterium]|nr:site-2 protease family protein [Anaerolineaceae bacterium]MBN2677240.1 site-2 protease family protein [Anaerolineaceae bacterium]